MDDMLTLPLEQPSLFGIGPLLRALQAERPIARVRSAVGDEIWLVTRHADVRALLADERLGRSHPDPERAARTTNSALFGGAMGNPETEDADHAQMRALLTPAFSPRRMRALQRHVGDLVDRLLDELEQARGPVDLHEALSFPLPVLVICELLGVPYTDRDRFSAWSRGAADTRDRQRSQSSLAQLVGYMHELVARKRAEPGDDVISELIAAHSGPHSGPHGGALGGPLSDDDIAELSAGLLFAGHVTTVTRIDFGALLLMTNPDQRDALLRDPSLVVSAVEEVLRCLPGGSAGIPRYARTDMDIGGVTVRAGEAVVLDLAAANYDASAFADPDRFRIARAPNPHVTFGHGARYCIGAGLARVELEAVFSRLFSRFPGLRLAVPVEQLELVTDTLDAGLAALPVDW